MRSVSTNVAALSPPDDGILILSLRVSSSLAGGGAPLFFSFSQLVKTGEAVSESLRKLVARI